MTLRTLALALALACGFTAIGEAKKNVVRPVAKHYKLKIASKQKFSHKVKRGKGRRAVAKVKHR